MIRAGKQRESIIDRMGGRVNCIAMAIFAVVFIAVFAWIENNLYQANQAQYIDSWPITINKNIELTWAGKGAAK